MLQSKVRARRLSAAITLASYVWVMVSPAVAYAKEAAEAEPVQMVPLSDYSRIDGGSLSTASDRTSATTEERAESESDGPKASTGSGFEDPDDPNDGADPTTEVEGEGDGTSPDDPSPEVPQTGTVALALPSGDDKSGV